MHNIAFFLLVAPFLCFSQVKKPDSSSINIVVRNIDQLSNSNSKLYTRNKIVNHSTVIEKWHYFDNKQLSRITINYRIDSPKYSIAYAEKYYFKNGALIYAYENETLFLPEEGIDEGTTWAGDFYFSKGKLIDYVTLGHGRSESDDWNPQKEIIEKLRKRKLELKTLK